MNSLFDLARYQLLTGDFDWRGLSLELIAWAGTPHFDPTDETVADFKTHGAVEVGRSLPITSVSAALNGTAQTNHVVISEPPTGLTVTHFTMGKKVSGDAGELILFVDDADEMPFVTNGLDIVVTPDWALNRGWFRP